MRVISKIFSIILVLYILSILFASSISKPNALVNHNVGQMKNLMIFAQIHTNHTTAVDQPPPPPLNQPQQKVAAPQPRRDHPQLPLRLVIQPMTVWDIVQVYPTAALPV